MEYNNSEDRKLVFLGKIQKLVRSYYEGGKPNKFIAGESTVSLMEPSYSWEEVNQVIESLFSTQITLNSSAANKVNQFEKAWSHYIGSKNGVMVNSGSSANLLALFILANPTIKNHINHGDEIITPAVTWHTTVSPIISIGAVPVLVDVTLPDCTIDVDKIESVITNKTKAIMPVHLLGNPCDMETILNVAKKYNLYVIEDACEAHGAEFNRKKCGGMGDIGTFSFFFSHHITTMEGGMLMTNNEEIAELGRIMRSQGVIRNTSRRVELEKYYRSQEEYKELDPNYLFANMGFNLRPTELNGGFGIEQIKKIGTILEQRMKNGEYWSQRLERYRDYFYLPTNSDDGKSWFCFPLIIKPGSPFSRRQITKYLNDCNIENRPIMAGNIARHPAMKYFKYHASDLVNSELIHNNGFFWGNHQKIKLDQCEYVADCVDKFMKKY